MLFLFSPHTSAEEVQDPKALEVQSQAIEQLQKQIRLDNLSKELSAKAQSLVGKKTGQCTLAVRSFLGVGPDEIHGYVQTTINSHDPYVGSIIVIVGRSRHSGVVLFSTPTEVTYYDSNGDWKETSKIRTIKVTDKRIKGYHVTKKFSNYY